MRHLMSGLRWLRELTRRLMFGLLWFFVIHFAIVCVALVVSLGIARARMASTSRPPTSFSQGFSQGFAKGFDTGRMVGQDLRRNYGAWFVLVALATSMAGTILGIFPGTRPKLRAVRKKPTRNKSTPAIPRPADYPGALAPCSNRALHRDGGGRIGFAPQQALAAASASEPVRQALEKTMRHFMSGLRWLRELTRRLMFGFLWFLVLWSSSLFVGGVVAGGIAGARLAGAPHPPGSFPSFGSGFEAGRMVGQDLRRNYGILFALGAFATAMAGTLLGVFPGTRPKLRAVSKKPTRNKNTPAI